MIAKRAGILLLGLGLACWALPAAAQTKVQALSAAQQAVNEGQALSKQGKHAEAEKAYRRALAMDPSLAGAYEGLAGTLFLKRKYREGAALARKGLSKVRTDKALLRAWLGMHLYSLKQRKEAYENLKHVPQELPGEFQLQAVAAQACRHAEDYPCVVAAVDNYFKVRPDNLAKQDFKFKVMQAGALTETGQHARAEKILREVLSKHRDYLPAVLALAVTLRHQGKCVDAVALHRDLKAKLPAKHPAQVKNLLGLAESNLCARRYNVAAKRASEYLRLRPGDPEALLVRGDAAMGMNQNEGALRDFQAVARQRKGDAAIDLRIAKVHYRMKAYDKAAARLAPHLKAAKAEPQFVQLGLRVAVRRDKREQALQLAQRLLALSSPTAGQLYFAGVAHSSAGRFQQAAEIYQRALKQNARYPRLRLELIRALSHLARRAFAANDWSKAAALLQRAHKVEPASLAVNRNLALLELRRGKGAAAMPYLERMLKKVPKDIVANRLKARALLAQKDVDGAIKALELAKREAAGGLMRARVLGELGALRLRQGELKQGLRELVQARQIAIRGELTAAQKALLARLGRNVARANLALAQNALGEGKEGEAWARIKDALVQVRLLPDKEKIVVRALAAFAAMEAGEMDEGRKLVKQLGPKVRAVLRQPYRKVGGPLIQAYLDYLSPGVAAKQKAAKQLARLAKRLPKGKRAPLIKLAASAHEQVGFLLFKEGKLRAAEKAFAAAQRAGGKGAAPAQRYNLAVLHYLSGAKAKAVAQLEGMQNQVAMAQCAMGVYYEQNGKVMRAHQLFKSCLKRGGQYPGVKSLVEARQRVLGEVQQ